MTAGFQALNTTGNIQIDDTYKNSKLVASGRFNAYTANISALEIYLQPLGISCAVEMPLVFVRPVNYGGWVGGISYGVGTDSQGNYNGNDIIYISDLNVSSFDYAVFSTVGTPIASSGTVGLQVFNSLQQIVYDSNNFQPRITDSIITNANTGMYYPFNINLSGSAGKPWILANSLLTGFYGAGSEGGWAHGIYAKLVSDTVITIDHCILGPASYVPARDQMGNALAAQLEPYQGRRANYAFGTFNS